ncbi:MAG: NB-ARC domain-containing protein, partial [Bacteroidota bacterium]
MDSQNFFTKVRDRIKKGDLSGALEAMRQLDAADPFIDEIFAQSGRYADLRARIRTGRVSYEDATLTENQVRFGLLELLKEIEKEYNQQPTLKEKLDRSASIVAEIVFQDTIIYGDVYVNSKKQLDRQLTANPFLVEGFIGREDELEKLHARLFSGDSFLLLVNGDGGVGKTSLAARYYATYQEEYAHVAWVVSEKSITNALLLLAIPLGLRFPEEMANPERIQILLKALARIKKPSLLVIDNANEPNDLRENYQTLRRCSNFHILLTTRIRRFSEPVRYFPVGGLPTEKAVVLFRQLYPGHKAEEDDL